MVEPPSLGFLQRTRCDMRGRLMHTRSVTPATLPGPPPRAARLTGLAPRSRRRSPDSSMSAAGARLDRLALVPDVRGQPIVLGKLWSFGTLTLERRGPFMCTRRHEEADHSSAVWRRRCTRIRNWQMQSPRSAPQPCVRHVSCC